MSNTLTKEEILEKYCEKHCTFIHLQKGNNVIDGSADAVFEAMEEYAKQKCIMYAKFRDEYKLIEGMNHKHYVTDVIGMVTWIGASDEEICDAFMKGEQLKRWIEIENQSLK